MERGRRKHYRVIPGQTRRLDVSVRVEGDGRVFRGEVLDMTIDGAGVRFTTDAAPVVALGHSVMLTFSASWLDESFEVSGTVKSRIELGESREYRYGFAFDQSAELQKRLPSGVFQLFNRRGAYRVSTDPADPVAVTVRLPRVDMDPVTARLKDVSVSGLALLVSSGAEKTLGACDSVEMSFRLPTSDKDLHLVGWIRNRQLNHEHVRYGVEFDEERSHNFTRQQDEIFAYVMHRQREALQTPMRYGTAGRH